LCCSTSSFPTGTINESMSYILIIACGSAPLL
jgi:hypothetical protein